uniref:TSA: Wollemia nobilis Ref_Wollemi_Transcript_18896_2829 transcribed RNA sequence n=1 Tax=Wollemia nobilis TaxID=56998 RepID=A0A0C9RI43_9CONI
MAKAASGKLGNRFRFFFNLGFVFLLFVFLSDHVNLFKSPLYITGHPSRSSYRWSFQQSESKIGSKRPNNWVFGRKNVVSTESGSTTSERQLSETDHGFSRMLSENPVAMNANFKGTLIENLSEDSQSSRRKLAENSSVSDLENLENLVSCVGLEQHTGYSSRCEFIKAHKQCTSGGVVEYITFFYCTCEKWPMFGYGVLGLWLLALFYMLGNTAADYFCCSLEKLSKLLKLPPTVAGVTLLPLGNGAPDVFASIAAFIGADAGEVGLNSVLGGAVFVTCVVAGSVSLFVAGSQARIDLRCFVRDVCFFLFTLAALCLILIIGKINLLGAMAFLSIYIIYACTVAANEYLKKPARKLKWNSMTPMHSVPGSIFSLGDEEDEDDSIYSPLLDIESSTGLAANHPPLETSLPQWMWASNVAIYSNQAVAKMGEETRPLWGWSEESENDQSRCSFRGLLMSLLCSPLTLPRRLTIPIVEDDRWSRSVAVASVTLAPILLSLLWNTQESKPFGIGKMAYVAGAISGALFGFLGYFTTKPDHPPRTYLFPWVAGGFIMSIVWFYIIANELVALLVSLGVIFEIDPSILGLTVLAWGNSIGDLMSNIALALNGGDGVQIAMSGCYAGPMFNTLAGLGISLLLGSWSAQPGAYMVPKDTTLFYTLGFLTIGLVWALVVLPLNDMRPSKLLGIGLLILYSSFLILRLSNASGLFSISGLY